MSDAEMDARVERLLAVIREAEHAALTERLAEAEEYAEHKCPPTA